MTGWASFFAGFSAPIATVALAFSGYLGHFDQRFRPENARILVGSGEWTLQFGWAQAVACALVVLFTVLNLLGVQRAARVQNVLTVLKVAVLAVFVGLAFASGQGDAANFTRVAVRDVSTPLAAQFAISLFWIYVAYSGWNAATYVAEELRQPARTLPRALAIGTSIVAVLYFLLNVVFIYGAPLEDMKGKLAVAAFAASRLFGPQVAGIFSALMGLSLMATVNAMITIGPRVYYAMAKNGAFPAAAARVHPKWHTPAVAIVAQAICAMLMTMTPFPQLVIYIGFTLNFFAVMSVASLFLFRRRPGWQKLRMVSFCYPLFPALFLAIGAWMTFYGLQLKPFISLAAIATVVTGALVYHARWKSRTASAPAVETY
jgi:APA family basic amino acid/polyamine antiporter